jgi:hypothetical protein
VLNLQDNFNLSIHASESGLEAFITVKGGLVEKHSKVKAQSFTGDELKRTFFQQQFCFWVASIILKL